MMDGIKDDGAIGISAFYAGRSVLVTGSTGFMGKVLIEKLLRSCPDIGEIFLLLRPKKNMSIDERLGKMLSLPVSFVHFTPSQYDRNCLKSLKTSRPNCWHMFGGKLFDKIRAERPKLFEKLIPVTGDVTEEALGLPSVERNILIARVSIIFHVAASVRFDDSLKAAIFSNTRSTRDVCNLATQMKQLVVRFALSIQWKNAKLFRRRNDG